MIPRQGRHIPGARKPRAVAKADKVDLVGPLRWCLLVLIGFLVLALQARAEDAAEQEMVVSHGYSFYGDLKYPADFPHFDFVNTDAPKGGERAVRAV